MLFDTHAHLDYPDFESDRQEVLDRAQATGVTRIISIGTNIDSSQRAIELADLHSPLWATVGIHPCEAEKAAPDAVEALRALARHPRVVGLGEIGLDFYRLPTSLSGEYPEEQITQYKERQTSLFRAQLDLAVELNLNVVIHQRSSWLETLDVLRDYTGRIRGVYHCFGGTLDQAQSLFEMGHLVSFTGIVTFKNAQVAQATAAAVPLDKFMVETDCPYLAPVPYRGKRAEPSHTRVVAESLAALRGTTLEKISEATSQTALEFFNFDRT